MMRRTAFGEQTEDHFLMMKGEVMPSIRIVKDPVPSRWIYIAAGVVTLILLLLVFGKFYWASRPAGNVAEQPRLERALRAGASEFDEVRSRILVEKPQATIAPRALGDKVVELTTSVRNETGRTINGLALRGAVLDPQGTALRERTVVIVPAQQAVLAPGETMNVRILLEGLDPNSERADTHVEITGVSLG